MGNDIVEFPLNQPKDTHVPRTVDTDDNFDDLRMRDKKDGKLYNDQNWHICLCYYKISMLYYNCN